MSTLAELGEGVTGGTAPEHHLQYCYRFHMIQRGQPMLPDPEEAGISESTLLLSLHIEVLGLNPVRGVHLYHKHEAPVITLVVVKYILK